MNLNNFLYTHPIFRLEEFKEWKESKRPIEAASLHSSINFCIQTNKIKRIRRELFAVIPPNEKPETITFDPYLLAGKTTIDSIIAYHSALELHGLAYSTFQQFTFITQKKIKPFEIDSQWFQPVQIPIALKDKKKHNFGIQLVDRQGVAIKITNVARTFVDVIDRPDLCGGWEEVYRSINNINVLKFDEVLEYCLLKNNHTLNAKVGFFLDLRVDPFATPADILNKFQKLIPKSPQYMGNKSDGKYHYVKKWNLLVPNIILNAAWEEPNDDV